MSDNDTDFESDSFDEEAEPSPNSLAINLTSEWPIHTDGILAGNSLRNRQWLLTPKMLRKLAAQAMIKLQGPYKLQNRYVPTHLYPILFAEAARMKNDEAVSFLVATWPFEILNFNELELPLECHFGYFTRSKQEEIPLADSVIRGLLFRSRMHCRMKMLILPKDTTEASEIMKTFMRIGVHYLRDLPDVKLTKVLRNAQYYEGERYMELVKKLETKRPINWAAYRLDKVRLVIAMPVAVVHFMGKRQNFDDVVVGLILQRHSPFLFHFDDLALCNISETRLAGAILDRLVNPMGVTKLVLHNRRFYKSDDIITMVSTLSPVLRKFKRLRSFFVRIVATLGVQTTLEPTASDNFTRTMSVWKDLRRAGFDEQPLTGRLGMILSPMPAPLIKLSLINAGLKADDLRCLAASHHAPALRILRLDKNDLHAAVDVTLELIPRLTSIVVLQMRNCRLTSDDAVRIAAAVGQSRTIRSWTIAYNYVHTLEELKILLRLCSRSSSIREIGCRPAEFQQVCGRIFMHNRFLLTEEEKDILTAYGRSFNINVI